MTTSAPGKADDGSAAVPDERTVLTEMLDEQRAILRWKAGGLDRAGMAATLGASSLHLAGIVKHLTRVEYDWFAWVFAGEDPHEPWRSEVYGSDPTPDWEFVSAVDDDPEDLLAGYDRACARSREVVAVAASLDEQAVRDLGEWDGRPSLRWILAHMIEETARHNGHADLLREAVDGAVGEGPPRNP